MRPQYFKIGPQTGYHGIDGGCAGLFSKSPLTLKLYIDQFLTIEIISSFKIEIELCGVQRMLVAANRKALFRLIYKKYLPFIKIIFLTGQPPGKPYLNDYFADRILFVPGGHVSPPSDDSSENSSSSTLILFSVLS